MTFFPPNYLRMHAVTSTSSATFLLNSILCVHSFYKKQMWNNWKHFSVIRSLFFRRDSLAKCFKTLFSLIGAPQAKCHLNPLLLSILLLIRKFVSHSFSLTFGVWNNSGHDFWQEKILLNISNVFSLWLIHHERSTIWIHNLFLFFFHSTLFYPS